MRGRIYVLETACYIHFQANLLNENVTYDYQSGLSYED
jgi:hypothetical protein